MDNKKFIIIFSILILVIIGLFVYSIVYTINKNNTEKNVSISIDEFNNIVLESSNFNTSKVSDITETDLIEVFGIDKESINKFYGKKSVLSTDACMYLLLETVSGKQDAVYSQLENFALGYEEDWNNYLEAQYDIVVDRKIGKIDNYIYLVISDDSYDILKQVEK